MFYKIESTGAKIVLIDNRTTFTDSIRSKFPDINILNTNCLYDAQPINKSQLLSLCQNEHHLQDTRYVIFTSGTTGHPKGVELTYSNYACNRNTFEKFLNLEDPSKLFVSIVVNPLHHTNSTSITDWALRRPKSQIHLLERYSTSYWSILSSVVASHTLPSSGLVLENISIIAPLVSRHIDFLESLVDTNTLGVEPHILKKNLSQTVLLLGSAPVGPKTCDRLLKYAGRLPTVRFGSTETTLQVMKISFIRE